ncbi:MAG: universal stress protein [Candidatus Binatia bacterium]
MMGNVAEEIIQIAEQFRTDLLVLGSRGLTGEKRFPLGSVVQKVVRHAPCSVLVVRKNA